MLKMVDRAPVSRGDFNNRERARNMVGACSADRFGRRHAHRSAARESLKQPRWVLLGFFVIASEGRNALPRELAHFVANGGLRFVRITARAYRLFAQATSRQGARLR